MTTPTTEVQTEAIQTALEGVLGLSLLRDVLADSASQAVLALLQALVEGEAGAVAGAYGAAYRALAQVANAEAAPGLADAWQAHLALRLIDDADPWSEQAERGGPRGVAPALRGQARRDLRALQRLGVLDADSLWQLAREQVAPAYPALARAWAPWLDLAPPALAEREPTPRQAICREIVASADWAELAEPLEAHWARHGAGPLARYAVLRWLGREAGLQGVAEPDPVQLDQLIAYEREQGHLRTNLERFLAGLPAHHALLYGAPGTGKSSTVKALANAYAERGLRLVEVRKEQLRDLAQIVAPLRGRAPRYLLFVDDLSFEEHETEYKALKVLLEGTVEARPANVLLHATTNRFNLIREQFSDRGQPVDDVHWRDTLEEKVALVERFGLRVTFAAPDQARYLTIVEALAQQRGLALPLEALRERALVWQHRRPGRSGRLARQFVDELVAERGRA